MLCAFILSCGWCVLCLCRSCYGVIVHYVAAEYDHFFRVLLSKSKQKKRDFLDRTSSITAWLEDTCTTWIVPNDYSEYYGAPIEEMHLGYSFNKFIVHYIYVILHCVTLHEIVPMHTLKRIVQHSAFFWYSQLSIWKIKTGSVPLVHTRSVIEEW